MIRKKTPAKAKASQKARKKPKPVSSTGSARRNENGPTPHPAIALLDEWWQDKSGYDAEAWAALKKALDEERDRVGARRLFDD
jgi:hypothetical protein